MKRSLRTYSGIAMFVVLLNIEAKAATYTVDQLPTSLTGTFSLAGQQEMGTIGDIWLVDPTHQKPTIKSFCTDVFGTVTIGSTPAWAVLSGQGKTGLDPNPAHFWAPGGFENAMLFDYIFGSGAHGDALHAAGAQLAVWELLYDSTAFHQGSWNLASGRFELLTESDPQMLTVANQYLTQFAGLSASQLQVIENDWLTPLFPANGRVVSFGQGVLDPHPVADSGPTTILLGMACIAMAWITRRERVMF